MAIIIVSDTTIQKLVNAINNQTAAVKDQTQSIDNQTKVLSDLTSILKKIEADINPPPVKIQIKFDNQEIGMPIQLTDSGAGSSTIATASETDAAGNPVVVDPASVTFGVSDPSAFTLTPNNTASDIQGTDGAGNPVTIPSGGCQFTAVGTVGHLGAFQATVQDTKNNLNAQDTITVVTGASTSLNINFSPAS